MARIAPGRGPVRGCTRTADLDAQKRWRRRLVAGACVFGVVGAYPGAAHAADTGLPGDYGAAPVAHERRGFVDSVSGEVVRDAAALARRMLHDGKVSLVVSGEFVEFDEPDSVDAETSEVVGVFEIGRVLKGVEFAVSTIRILVDEGVLQGGAGTNTRAFERGEAVPSPWAGVAPVNRPAHATCSRDLPGGDIVFVRCGITIDDEGGAISTGETFVLGLAAQSPKGTVAVHGRYPYLAWGDEARRLVGVFDRESALESHCTEWRHPWGLEQNAIQHFFGGWDWVDVGSVRSTRGPATAERVRGCLENGTNPNGRDAAGRTALHWAAGYARDIEVVEALVDGGADVSARNKLGMTPATFAAENDHGAGILKYLLAAGAEPGEMAMHMAAINRDPRVIEILIGAGGDPNERGGRSGRTPLHDAAVHCGAYGDAHCRDMNARLEVLLGFGADVALRDFSGASALHWAARENANPKTLEALVRAGLVVEARDVRGATPLHYAAARQGGRIVTTLLSAGAGAAARDSTGAVPLHWAARSGDTGEFGQVVRALELAGAALDERDDEGKTALHYAVQDPLKARLLVAAGANVSATDASGRTPLDIAVAQGHLDTAKVLRAAQD